MWDIMQTSFLLPETKCGFFVSEKRKKIWQIQIGLIEELARVCECYHLRYFASNGTLLGAVRHGGFIPWDDDVDIVMPRPDYQKLIEISQEEFSAPFHLHTPENGIGYYRSYIRLRNSRTTAIPMKDLNSRDNNGIFIDIFPMDGCSSGKFFRKWHFLLITGYSAMANTYTYYPDFDTHRFFRTMLYFFSKIYCKIHGYKGLLQRIENLRSRIPYDSAEEIYVITHGRQCLVFPRVFYEETKQMAFEYIKLPVPTAYDEVLKKHYGDYKKLPPVEKRGQHHSIFFDPDKPYEEYVNVMTREEMKKQLNNF